MSEEIKRCSSCFSPMVAEGPCPVCGADDAARNEPHQLQIGTVLKEQYCIGKVLGQGGFGITYLGWDLYLEIPVAIKEYYPSGMVLRDAGITMNVTDVGSDEGERFRNNRDRFMREAKMLARFSQVPEVVQVRNFFLANNTAYIVMEYVQGITLKQYVKERGGKLTARETLAILGPMIRTLAKVHKTGIVHRDINPANIMMVDGGAKLLDFGAVRMVADAAADQELSKSTESILTQGYAPMEQYQKRGALGPWTDVYAICATILYCITGQVPPDALGRVMGDEVIDFDLLPGLTPKQQKALAHGMELRADWRTASMDKLYEELFPVEEPTPPPPPPAPVPSKRKSKKSFRWKKALFSAVAAVVLCLAALVAIGWSQPDDASPVSDLMGENVVSGMCGDAAQWYLDLDTGLMQIDGVHMYDFYVEEYDESLRQDRQPRPWKEYTDIITEVILDENLNRLGSASFAHCPNLKKVHFGKHLKEIGMDAFWDSGLESIDLPASLEVIECAAFEQTRLREVSIPLYVRQLDQIAFGSCPNLEKVEILSSIKMNFDTWRINPIFSQEGHSVENITIWAPPGGIVESYANAYGYQFQPMGSGVTYEAEGDFSGFPGNVDGHWYYDSQSGFLMIEGEMPTDMKGQWEIDQNIVTPERENVPLPPWFSYREKITAVYIAEGVTRITDNAFAWCHNLTDIHLPSTLKSIGFQSFLDTSLDEIFIPDSVTDIHSYAFNYCRNLRTARLPMELEKLERSVFNCCFQLERVYMGNGTQLECEMEGGKRVTPFNSGSQPDNSEEENPVDESQMPWNLTIFTSRRMEGEKVSPAASFAQEYGVGYEEGVFLCE